jgi:general secretion pathway protein C
MSLLALVLLAGSIAYWGLQLFPPAQRPLAPTPVAARPEPSADAAATLFGGDAAAAVVSNYQLTGVVAGGRNSVAILVADGAPPKAIKVGGEIAPGVTVRQVHPRYVMLSDGGVMKRVELAIDPTASTSLSISGSAQPGASGTGGPGGAPQTVPGPQMAPGGRLRHMQEVAPAEAGPQPIQGGSPEPAAPPPPPPPEPIQMPEPVRSSNSPVSQPPSSQ